jgi:hypothetical protein
VEDAVVEDREVNARGITARKASAVKKYLGNAATEEVVTGWAGGINGVRWATENK